MISERAIWATLLVGAFVGGYAVHYHHVEPYRPTFREFWSTLNKVAPYEKYRRFSGFPQVEPNGSEELRFWFENAILDGRQAGRFWVDPKLTSPVAVMTMADGHEGMVSGCYLNGVGMEFVSPVGGSLTFRDSTIIAGDPKQVAITTREASR